MLSSIKRHFSRVDAGVTQVAKDVFWLGVNDWDLREFHSMQSPVGTSYNSYLIKAKEPTIVDAVKHTLAHEWIARIQSIYGPDCKGLKRIISHHAEPDHTSGLPILVERFPHIEVVCTQMNFDTLSRFYNTKKWNVRIVKLGEPISLGDREVVLAGVPMAHWPESAVTYLPSQKILFSSDCFGQHIASTKRFMDEIDQCLFAQESASYFANILLRLKNPVIKALKTVKSLDGLQMVLPAHGVGIRRPQDLQVNIQRYTNWANQTPDKKVCVLYDCNWFGTEKMASAIASGAGQVPGVDVKMFHARKTHITRTVTEAMSAGAVAVGSPCLHESILPDLAMHLNYWRCLALRNKAGGIFGTTGWSEGVTPAEVRQQLYKPLNIKEVAEPIIAKWGPDDNDLYQCEEMGKKLGLAAVERAEKSRK